jgi:hypothetical protein
VKHLMTLKEGKQAGRARPQHKPVGLPTGGEIPLPTSRLVDCDLYPQIYTPIHLDRLALSPISLSANLLIYLSLNRPNPQ